MKLFPVGPDSPTSPPHTDIPHGRREKGTGGGEKSGKSKGFLNTQQPTLSS